MQTLKVGYNNALIRYGAPSEWTTRNVEDGNGGEIPVYYTTNSYASIFIAFRGTGLKFFGGGRGSVNMVFDDQEIVSKNLSQWINNTATPVIEISGEANADHQFIVAIDGEVWVNYFLLESSTGNGFQLLNTGPYATEVPSHALLEDEAQTFIRRTPESAWRYETDIAFHGYSVLSSRTPGAELLWKFYGKAVWLYANLDPSHGNVTVIIDGVQSPLISMKVPRGRMMQKLFYHTDGLDADSEHSLKIIHKGEPGEYVSLDFMRILLYDAPPTLPPPNSTEVRPVHSSRMAMIIGSTFAGVTLIALLSVTIFAWWKKRRHKAAKAEVTRANETTVWPRMRLPHPDLISSSRSSDSVEHGNDRSPQMASTSANILPSTHQLNREDSFTTVSTVLLVTEDQVSDHRS